MENFLNKLKRLIDRADTNPTQIAYHIKVTPQFMSSVMLGKTLLSKDRLDQILNFINASQEERKELIELLLKAKIDEKIKPLLQEFDSEVTESLLSVPDAEIPVVSRVAANDEIGYAHFIPYDTPYRRIKTRGCKAMDVDSDSMSPVALKGQTILYDASKDVRDGDLALVILKDGSQLFKRLFFSPKGYVTLQSVNSMYPPVIVEEDRVKDMHRVVGVWF